MQGFRVGVDGHPQRAQRDTPTRSVGGGQAESGGLEVHLEKGAGLRVGGSEGRSEGYEEGEHSGGWVTRGYQGRESRRG